MNCFFGDGLFGMRPYDEDCSSEYSSDESFHRVLQKNSFRYERKLNDLIQHQSAANQKDVNLMGVEFRSRPSNGKGTLGSMDPINVHLMAGNMQRNSKGIMVLDKIIPKKNKSE